MAKKKYIYPYRETSEYKGQPIDVKAKTTKELIEKVAKRKAEIDKGLLDENVKLEDWTEKWIETYKSGKVSGGWEKSIRSILNTSIPDEIKHLPIGKIITTHAQQILNSASGKSESQIHKLTILLTALFEVARKNKMIADNPMDLVAPPRGTKNKRRAVTEYERKHILALIDPSHAGPHRAGLFIKIMLYCGLRPQEVATLQWKNVDLKEGIIKIETALKDDNSIGPPKSESGYRDIPIPLPFAEELKKLKPKNSPFAFVCTNASGRRHTHESIRQMWDSFIYHLNIEMKCKTNKRGKLLPPYPVADDLVLYCLRHTYGTDMIRAGVDIYTVKDLMGHSSVTVTEGYTHKSKEPIKKAAKLINKFHGVKKKSGKPTEKKSQSV